MTKIILLIALIISNQKADLSKKIIGSLKLMFPDVPFLSINVRDFEKSTYCNKSMV